ncbi:hypothetical protein GCM10020255_048060 [Rhodococcus baikonurensis]
MEIHVILVRIALGLVLGAAVGIERQWRARMAGLRTNALVSLGATLFVIMGAYGFEGRTLIRRASQRRSSRGSASSVPG